MENIFAYTWYDNQDDMYPKSLWRRSLFFRPLPEGRRVLVVLIQCVFLFVVEGVNDVLFQTLLIKYFDESRVQRVHSFFSFASFHLLLCLPMGFIADRYFGRAKVLYVSWILLFIAHLMFGIYFVIISFVPHEETKIIVGVSVLAIGVIINSLSLAGIRVNLISFGADQMETASSEQFSSYFHWYYWCRSVGLLITYSLGVYIVAAHGELAILLSFIAAMAGMMTNFVAYKWFIKITKRSNPLLLVYRVLRYAATKKKPAERSAFSYDDRPEPSGIDLAKKTHHGIFNDEQVEDVKTFLRILVVIFSLLGILCAYLLLRGVYLYNSKFLEHSSSFVSNVHVINGSNCSSSSSNTVQSNVTVTIHQFHDYYSGKWIFLINIGAILLMLPTLDRLVYPLLCPWVPSMFNRIKAGMIFSLASVICAIIVEVVRYITLYSQDSAAQVNMFRYEKMVSVSIPVGVIAPQYFLQAIAECLAIPTILEFIYAQSPSYMKGLLLGCFFFIYGLAITLGSLLFLSQSSGTQVYWEYLRSLSDPCDAVPDASGSCVSAYIIITVITILGSILFCYSAKHYKPRARGNDLRYFIQYSFH